jgi:prepilin-type N-terminal cleavage/methylation domain-containing protein
MRRLTMNKHKIKVKGFTLIEMILVLVIISGVLVLGLTYTRTKTDQMRRETIARQMQLIMNAAMAFYVTNGAWPETVPPPDPADRCTGGWREFNDAGDPNQLQDQTYLPTPIPTPSGNPYEYQCDAVRGLYQVRVELPTEADRLVVANSIPLGTVQGNFVVGQVPVPGQNLNNARSLNFAGIYYAGSCVPAPTCPLDMEPNIVVTPASVSGVNNAPTCTGDSTTAPFDPQNCSGQVYPISSFIAFARGDLVTGAPTDPNGGGGAFANINNDLGPPLDCKVTSAAVRSPCVSTLGPPAVGQLESDGTMYWRVCLYVRTEEGIVYPTNPAWGKMMGSVAVFTRCIPRNEPIGSNNVFQGW